ncbi:MAG: acetylglutamate kinase [Candidatus Margulisbacteria bacterium]|nr:acetylglutamate kinase [Candidatus Margulisiibacteriota bacterium]
MINKYIEKAQILLEALPYIQKFAGKTIVIKYGGAAMENEALQKSVAVDIVLLKFVGINPVLVHGGGKEITTWLDKLNIETEFIDGLRKTSKQAMEVTEMVLTGKVNKAIVGLINSAGGKAIGLSGKDGNMIQGKKINEAKLGHAGQVTKVNPSVILDTIEKGYIPVISTVGVDENNETLNINADYVASDIAIAIKAEKLIYLSNVEGILNEKKEIIKQIIAEEAEELIKTGVISGGMIPKITSCLESIQGGVNNVHIISGEINHSILLELFTDYGIGTMIKKKE